MANAGKWHTKLEKDLIIKLGGTPLTKKGYDGKLNGKAVEVRALGNSTRQPKFKIDKRQHDELLKLKGNYIFVDVKKKKHKILSAKKVNKLLDENGHDWLTDYHYGKNWKHEFLWKNQIFKKA